ncbi:hypothetical protein D9611_010266 [Ephemerocybe angulata]|uniref:SH3 domain-containing protein n=1 Tax=Ephemerocybe angulata TaxID=980116 RepID=A0A8H5BBE5_9AGAR|nr:hypothetical protein D9611_010266 [Tulosesus angulatus]
MHAARQQGHADHVHLRRVIAEKLQARDVILQRSPQGLGSLFGGSFGGNRGGGGNGKGNNDGGKGRGQGNGRGGNGNGNSNSGNSGNGGNSGGNGGSQSTSTTTTKAGATSTSSSQAPAQTSNTPTTPGPNSDGNANTDGGTGDNGNNTNNGAANNNGGNSKQSDGAKEGDATSKTDSSSTVSNKATSSVETGAASSTKSANDGTSSSSGSATVLAGVGPTTSADGTAPTESGTGSPLAVSGATAKPGMSGSLIAGLVILFLLIFFFVLALFVRRRWISRRRDRVERWWFTRKRNSQSYDDKKPEPVHFNEKALPDPPNPDLRGSSAPSFEREPSPLDLASIVPSAPPIAEVRAHHGQGHHAQMDSDRFSIGSASSGGSSQYIVVHNPHRRGSQTESFKFPKPPPSSRARHPLCTLAPVAASPVFPVHPELHSQHSLSHPPVTATQPLTVRTKLSADKIPNPFMDAGERSATSTIFNPFTRSPFDDEQAFSAVGNFAEIETIRRPYRRTLPDELEVTVDEKVRVLEIFDDGWAMVEQIRVGKPDETPVERGLVPVACLRDIDEDLSTFLNTKQVQAFQVANQTTE